MYQNRVVIHIFLMWSLSQRILTYFEHGKCKSLFYLACYFVNANAYYVKGWITTKNASCAHLMTINKRNIR